MRVPEMYRPVAASSATPRGGLPNDSEEDSVVTLDQVPRWIDAEHSLENDNRDPLAFQSGTGSGAGGSVCRFPGDHEINSRIYLWRGDPWNLEIDAVVNSTNEVHCFNDVIPTFHNLTNLQINSLNYRWNFLVQVLKYCPMLQELRIDEAGEGPDANEETWTRKDDKESWVEPDVVPQCLSLHLKSCHLLSFLSLHSELLLAIYILKNARVLQTMVIWNGGNFLELERLLSLCPKASSTCKLTVYDVPFDDASEPNSPLDASEPNSPMDASEPNSPLDANEPNSPLDASEPNSPLDESGSFGGSND
ncbi:unnamed protein product [Trifolium pratense]|uniref:Uncharacterized protein n=1 Tax=Trifolium pratense TaxID=57577 RepID=A0ACB0KGL9_TRIPR|nr:unnamed protein product [Trifolium pratense]